MRYADSKCTYREVFPPEYPSQGYVFTGKCVITGAECSVFVPGAELYAYRQGALIQNAMPSVSVDDREFLMSGMSPAGWKATFGDESDDPQPE